MTEVREYSPTNSTQAGSAVVTPTELKINPEFLRKSAEGARQEFFPTEEEQKTGTEFNPLKADAWRSAGNLMDEVRMHVESGQPLTEDFWNALQAQVATALYSESSASQRARIAQRELDLETRARGDSNIRAALAERQAADAQARATEAERIARKNETTHLPNHIALKERLEKLANAEDYQERVISLLYLDVEGLGLVNDTISHEAGDYMLREVAKILAKTIRDDDLLYHSTEDEDNAERPDELESGGRLYHKHGDELQILLNGLSPEVARIVSQRIADALKKGLLPALQSQGYLVERTQPIACGIGIASKAQGEMKTPEQMMHEGDIAMKTSKKIRQSNIRMNHANIEWQEDHPEEQQSMDMLPTSGIISINDGTLLDPGYIKDKSLVE